jgi:predicted nucleic acid-binding protein
VTEVVFADAGYWIALLSPDDDLHERARRVSAELEPRIITSELVMTEVLNAFCGFGPELRSAAVQLVEGLAGNPNVELVACSRLQFRAAVNLYRERPDKAWSIVDCSSFQIMQEHGLRLALAHDRHFEQAGFVALLR